MSSELQSLKIASLITASFLVIEFIGGLLTNSLALIADSVHMFRDLFSLALSLLAAKIALRPPTLERTFGYKRVEVLAAFVNALILIPVPIFIFYEAYIRYSNPQTVKSLEMLVIACLGLMANVISIIVLKGHTSNINVKGAVIHVFSDTLASVGVVLAGLVMIYTNFYIIDPITSVFIGSLVLLSSVNLFSDTVRILLESKPREIDFKAIETDLRSVKGVEDVHDMHIWSLTKGVNLITAHVVVKDPDRMDSIRRFIEKVLKERHGITHSTIQFECEKCGEISH